MARRAHECVRLGESALAWTGQKVSNEGRLARAEWADVVGFRGGGRIEPEWTPPCSQNGSMVGSEKCELLPDRPLTDS